MKWNENAHTNGVKSYYDFSFSISGVFFTLAFFLFSFCYGNIYVRIPNPWLFTTVYGVVCGFILLWPNERMLLFSFMQRATMFYFVSWMIFGLIHPFIHPVTYLICTHMATAYRCPHQIIIPKAQQMRNDTFGWPFILIVVDDGKYFGFFAFTSSRLMFHIMACTVYRIPYGIWSMDHCHH